MAESPLEPLSASLLPSPSVLLLLVPLLLRLSPPLPLP